MLRQWQKEIIRDIYDPVDELGFRLRRNVLLSMAKKNGKTALIAALVLVHLVGPEAGYGQEIYSAANSKEQAALIYKAAAGFVRLSDDLSRLVTPIASTKRIVCHAFGSFYEALSADVATREGISPTVWIYDELGKAKSAELYDSLSNAQGAWKEPLGIVISVQSSSSLALMSELVDDALKVIRGETPPDETLCAFIYSVPVDVNPFDETYWPLANPALGDFLALEDMRAAARKAKRLPSRLNGFRNYRLNQQVAAAGQLIDAEIWKACGGPVDLEQLRGRRCYGGLDLSKRLDLTAFAGVFPPNEEDPDDDGLTYCLVRCWTPEVTLPERELRDKAPYQTWVDQGHLIAAPGKTINYRWVAKEIGAFAEEYDLRAIAYDKWRGDVMLTDFEQENVPVWIKTKDEEEPPSSDAICLVPWGQTFQHMNPAIEAIEMLLVEEELRHGMHPVLTWAASNAIAKSDTNQNRMLDKKRARNRIDPFVALTMAAGLAARRDEFGDAKPTGSIYDDPDALAKIMGD